VPGLLQWEVGGEGLRMRARWTMVAAVLGSGMVFLDSTVVTVALPAIGRELPTSVFGVLEGQSYVYNGYLLTLSALLIPAGALTDVIGRRRMFAVGVVAFGLTSALCGLAPNMELLVLGRLLQGAAGAILVPGSLALLTAEFTGEQRGRAFGIWAGASGATTILGPVVGGLLVDTVSWRAVFLLNLPLAALATWATLRYVAESREPDEERMDWLGAALVAVAVGGLTFGGIRGQERAWQDPAAFVALGAGALALLGVPWRMLRARHPLVPPALFRSRNFTVTNISTVLIYGGLYVSGYFLVLYLQGTVGYNATAAGLATLPSVLFLTFFSARFGALAGRHGPRWFMAVGPAVMAAGLVWLAAIPATTTVWAIDLARPATLFPPLDYAVHVLPGQTLYGIGLMIVVAPLTTALMNSVPVDRAGVASAFNNAVSRVGPQLATAVLFVAVTSAFYSGLAERVPGLDVGATEVRAQLAPLNAPADGVPRAQAEAAREASEGGFALAMLAAAAMIAVGGAINGVGIRNPPAPAGGGNSVKRAPAHGRR
jgi:EmrB/QacA subfamily drug resistance transporter